MRIKEVSERRLVLAGVPQGDQGLWLLLLVGVVFAVGPGLMFRGVDVLPVQILVWLFVAAGVAMIVGYVVMKCRREQLRIDKLTSECVHERWSILGGARETTQFQLCTIAGVRVRHRVESKPGSGTGMQTINVWQASAKISKPRRVLVLAEENTSHGRHVRDVGSRVAEFLGVELDEDIQAESA